jgi:hypothetical protein
MLIMAAIFLGLLILLYAVSDGEMPDYVPPGGHVTDGDGGKKE